MSALKQDQAVILIIDSDPLMMTGMAAVLHMEGYECHCAQSSEAALKAASSLELDLIVCDVRLKHESGLALCKRIHETRGDVIPVVYLSSSQQPDIIRRAHEAGAAYYLRKPFEPTLLTDLVGKALWMPHLVQSNLEAKAGSNSTVDASSAAPIQIQPLGDTKAIPAASETTHKHAASPAPMRKSKKKAANMSGR